MHRLLPILAFATVVAVGAATIGTRTATAHAVRPLVGPPWISIEYPGNPFDRTDGGAYLYAHTFHHGNPIDGAPRGAAEGIVNGQRRSVPLTFRTTPRPGTYALKQQWPREGTWMLVISTGPANGAATAMVDIGSAGEVTAVRVPTTRRDGWAIPAQVSAADVDSALRARSAQVARGASATR